MERTLGTVILIAASVLISSCEEHLPVRSDPNELFKASVTSEYVLQFLENDVRFTVNVVNVFDETLQDTADLQGQLRVTFLGDPSVVRTLYLTVDSLITRRMYDRSTHLLTIDPGDTLKLLMKWDLRDDRGTSLPSSVFRYSLDQSCSGRFLSEKEIFALDGSISVLRKTGPVAIPNTGFALCYVSKWVPGTYCPPPITPCDPRPIP